MSRSLPSRANLEHLRNEAKQRLKTMQAQDPGARLADAQLAIAREYGFASWRRLKAAVDEQDRSAPARPTPAAGPSTRSPRPLATPISSCSCASTRSATSATTT